MLARHRLSLYDDLHRKNSRGIAQFLLLLIVLAMIGVNAHAKRRSHDPGASCGSGQSPNLSRTQNVTTYYTPESVKKDRRACQMEGTCIYQNKNGEQVLYNSGKEVKLSKTNCKQGIGVRGSCLDQCRSLAANNKLYPPGTVIYMPSLAGTTCGGKTHDGLMIVQDTGGAFKGAGKGRFDFFIGKCSKWGRNDTCSNPSGISKDEMSDLQSRLRGEGRSGGKFCIAGRTQIAAGEYAEVPTAIAAQFAPNGGRVQVASIAEGARN